MRLGAALLLLGCVPAAPATAAPVFAAHRGVTESGEVDNSIEAIRRTSASGVDAIEIDLRLTADGAVVLFHDPRIDVPGKGATYLARLTLADLTASDGTRLVPTFAEALDATTATGTRLLLDLKRPGSIDPAQVMELARRHNALDRIIIGARTADEVRAYRQHSPTLPILAFATAHRNIEEMIAAGATIIRLWPRWIFDPNSGCMQGASQSCLVQQLQRRGLRVWALADPPARDDKAQLCFAALKGLELDGILTDRPLLAKQALLSSAPPPSRFPGLRRCTW